MGLVARRIESAGDVDALRMGDDMNAAVVQIHIDLGTGIEALDRLGDRVDAALAGHAVDLHQKVLAGVFHRVLLLAPRARKRKRGKVVVYCWNAALVA